MGYHYVPKYYLLGFCQTSSSELIVRYEKGSRDVLKTTVNNVAQETGFYSPEIEDFLASNVEGPANVVLDKIRACEAITDDDRFTLCVYMVAMLKRVPESRISVQKRGPAIALELAVQIDRDFEQLLRSHPDRTDIIMRKWEEAKRLNVQFGENVPKGVWLQTVLPQTAPRLVRVLHSMRWRFLVCEPSSGFLTSDNPVFYHREIGVGRLHSELTFPISHCVTLWATHRKEIQEKFARASAAKISEINHRTVRSATQYVFFSREEDWVKSLVNRQTIRVNPMVRPERHPIHGFIRRHKRQR
jgi:hypothetical protein